MVMGRPYDTLANNLTFRKVVEDSIPLFVLEHV